MAEKTKFKYLARFEQLYRGLAQEGYIICERIAEEFKVDVEIVWNEVYLNRYNDYETPLRDVDGVIIHGRLTTLSR